MNPPITPRKWMGWCLLAFGWLATVLSLQAQGTGTIQGRVYNPATQQYVRNAEVRLEGTNIVTTTGGDGSFTLNGVPAGEAKLSVSYTGYQTATDTLTVSAGQTAVREISIVSTSASATTPGAVGTGVIQLSAFTVSTEREGNAKAINEQKQNMNIVTSIASDVFGDVTDGNIGEFLKMLPGVDIDYVESETRGPRLGGMDGQYVGFSVDGAKFASADANRTGDGGRATSFEAFSISSIESIEISRTTSSDMDADSPAGTINMKTRRAFDRKGRRIQYNASVNINSEEFHLHKNYGPGGDRQYKARPNYAFEYSDSFFNQRFGFVASVNRVDSYTEQYRHNMTYNKTPTAADPRPMVLTALNFKDGNKLIQKDSYNLTMDWKVTPKLVLSSGIIYNYALGQFFNRELTFNSAANNANALIGRSTVLGDGVTEVRTNGLATNTSRNSALAGGNASKRTHTFTFTPRFELKLDRWTVDGGGGYSRANNNYEALEKGHTRSNDVNSITSDFVATRPDISSYQWTIQQTSGPDWFDLNNRTNPRVTNEGRRAYTEIYAGDLNARWVTPIKVFPIALKFGGKYTEELRKNGNETSYNTYQYIGPGGGTTGSFAAFPNRNYWDTGTTGILTIKDLTGTVRPEGIIRPDDSAIGRLFQSNPEYFVNNATVDNYYNAFVAPVRDVKQKITATYGMADLRVNSQIQVRTGLRWEKTENLSKDYDPLSKAELAAAGFAVNTATSRATTIPGLQAQYFTNPLVGREKEYDNFFPMISAKYQPLRNLQIHLGANKAISRPPVDSTSGVYLINEDTHVVTSPNPNLLPEYSKNYAARVAYYFEPAGEVSVTLTQNNIRNARITRRGTAEEFGVGDDPQYDGYEFQAPFNEPNPRRHRNIEFSHRQTLPFKHEMLRGISLSNSYTHSYADARRSGLTPHRFSSGLSYAYKNFRGRAGVVWRDDTPDGSTAADYGRYRRHDTKLDIGGEYRVNRYLSIFAQGRNIFNGGQTWMEGPATQVQGQGAAVRVYENYGANWVFGVKGMF